MIFCAFAIFNVLEGPVPSDNFSMLVPKWKTAPQKPAISPVSGATKPCLVFGKLSGRNGALAAARPEGTIVVVGGGRGVDPLTILVKELRVLGCFTYVDEFTEVISLLTDGGLQVADLTSEITGIDDAPAAFERLRDASTMKIFIAPNNS